MKFNGAIKDIFVIRSYSFVDSLYLNQLARLLEGLRAFACLATG
jgi:hypothetical protein